MVKETNKYLFDKEAIFSALMRDYKSEGTFISEGRNSVRRAPDDRLGASLAFSINHFATGHYGSFKKIK